MTKSDDKRVPVLRFKGFTDDWEQRKFENLVSRLSKTSNNESLPNVTYDDIKSKENSLNKDITELTHGKKGIHFNKDDILFGKLRPYLGNILLARFNGIAVGDFWVLSPKDNNISSFLFDLIQTSKYKYISNLSSGSKMPRSDWNLVSKASFWVPIQQEQNKIGKIFQLIDNLVSLQQRKVNDLNSMKSALLQDVFPNTQGIKKIKLSTQEWNLQKISSIFKERNQRNKNGMLLSVSISKGIYPFSENDRKDNSSNDKSNYKEVKINDLAYNSMRMWQGAVGVSKYNGIVSPAYTVITPKKEENPNFYYYYFKNKRMLFNFRQHSQGLTSDTWNLKFPLFEKILIQVPSDKEEEQRVSSLFKQIDKSIELSKIQIKKLTSIKQFLLQNMFI